MQPHSLAMKSDQSKLEAGLSVYYSPHDGQVMRYDGDQFAYRDCLKVPERSVRRVHETSAMSRDFTAKQCTGRDEHLSENKGPSPLEALSHSRPLPGPSADRGRSLSTEPPAHNTKDKRMQGTAA